MLPLLAPRGLRPAALAALLAAHLAGAAPTTAQEGPDPGRTAAWLGAGALLGGALLLDQGIRSTLPEGGGASWTPLTEQLNHLGNPRYLVPALAAGYAGGSLARVRGLPTGSAHVFAALVVAGVANGTVKYAVGRQRPAGGESLSFRPFNSSNRWQSFPSGHAVVAFSVAAAVSEEADRTWVSALSYGTASLVGWSRVYADKHWASDVVGGALIGTVSSRVALHLLHRRLPHGGEPAPAAILLRPDGVEVRFRTR
jgi:membrane-associated phospholipid phosphatase